MPRVNKARPTMVRILLSFFSTAFKGLILPFLWYLFSMDCPMAMPKATPIAGDTDKAKIFSYNTQGDPDTSGNGNAYYHPDTYKMSFREFLFCTV